MPMLANLGVPAIAYQLGFKLIFVFSIEFGEFKGSHDHIRAKYFTSRRRNVQHSILKSPSNPTE